MRTRSISSIAALAALTVAFAGCSTNAGTPGPSSDGGGLEDFEAVTLTVSINEPEGVLNDYARDYFADIEEASEGKISFELFYAGSLLPGDQVLGGVADGLADIGQITPTFYPDELPIASWFQGLGFMAAKGWPLGALSEAGAAWETFRDTPEIQAEYAAAGVVPLYNNSTAPGDMICSKPSSTVAETTGLRSRVGGNAGAAEIALFGMTGEFLPTADVFEGLQRGVIDCVYGGGPAFGPLGWIEPAPYYLPLTGASAIGIGFVVNKDLWDGFPEEVRQIFNEAAPTAIARQQEVFVQVRAELVDQINALPNGVFQETPELNEILADYHQKLSGTVAETAPASLTDPEAFIEDFQAKLKNWDSTKLSTLGLSLDEGLDEEGVLAAPTAVDWAEYTSILQESVK